MDSAATPTYSLESLQQEFEFPEEIPSWDFSTDVLGHFDQFLDSIATSESTDNQERSPSAAASEPEGPSTDQLSNRPARGSSSSRVRSARVRRKRQNQLAQQRYRGRQKVRVEALESQIADTEAQLQELKASQRQLEARNRLLETVTSLRLSDDSGSSTSEGEWGSFVTVSEKAPGTITLTVLDDLELVKTVQDVGAMPFTEFAALYAAYADRIGHCLAEAAESGGSIALAKALQKWTCQCNSMRVFLAVADLKKYVAFSSSRLDGVMGVGSKELSNAWYQQLLAALSLTESQVMDVMYLRRLFYARLGALSRERRELSRQASEVSQVRGEETGAAQASTRLADLNALAQQLHDNSAAEFKTYMQLTSAYRRGILTGTQQAKCIALAFPYIADEPRTFEVLAAQRNEASLTTLTQPVGLDDFEHNFNWLQVASYLRSVTPGKLHDHVPLMSSQLVALYQTSRGYAATE